MQPVDPSRLENREALADGVAGQRFVSVTVCSARVRRTIEAHSSGGYALPGGEQRAHLSLVGWPSAAASSKVD
jgi:hypothetical protein